MACVSAITGDLFAPALGAHLAHPPGAPSSRRRSLPAGPTLSCAPIQNTEGTRDPRGWGTWSAARSLRSLPLNPPPGIRPVHPRNTPPPSQPSTCPSHGGSGSERPSLAAAPPSVVAHAPSSDPGAWSAEPAGQDGAVSSTEDGGSSHLRAAPRRPAVPTRRLSSRAKCPEPQPLKS